MGFSLSNVAWLCNCSRYKAGTYKLKNFHKIRFWILSMLRMLKPDMVLLKLLRISEYSEDAVSSLTFYKNRKKMEFEKVRSQTPLKELRNYKFTWCI